MFLGFDHNGRLAWMARQAIAIRDDGGVVEPFACALTFGFARVHAQEVDIVLVDRDEDDEEEAFGRIGEIEFGVFDGGKADVVPSEGVEDIERIEDAAREAREFVDEQDIELAAFSQREDELGNQRDDATR